MIAAGDTCTFGAVTLRFSAGARLIVDGTLNAVGTTFTEAVSGQGWGGIVVFEDAVLDFDGATVSEAEIGVLIQSDDVTISDSDFLRNEVGIESGYIADYCPQSPTGSTCVLPNPTRSTFVLVDSRVTASPSSGTTTGIGIVALNAFAAIFDTDIESNGGFGLVVWNATVDPYRFNSVRGNNNDGIRLLGNSDLLLSGFNDFGLNCVVDNIDDEIQLSADGYLFVGSGPFNGRNVIADDDLDNNAFLIARVSNSSTSPPPPILARYTYWGTSGPPPPGAFNTPVDASNPLAGNPCGPAGQRSALSPEARENGVIEHEVTVDLEWLRDDIRQFRAALAQALVQEDGAQGALRWLYEAQRLDRADTFGEHAETMALIASVRSLLVSGGALSSELREAAEAALVAEVADALRHDAYGDADELVAAHESLVTGEEAARSLSLHAAMVDEAAGRFTEALARVDRVRTALEDEGRFEEAEGPALVAAALEARMAAAGETEGIVAQGTQSRSAAVDSFRLLAPYPNPAAHSVTVPVVLGDAAEVRVAVYDVLGREVMQLDAERLEVGRHDLALDGTTLPGGVYLVRATLTGPGSREQVVTQRFTLLR